MFHIRRPGRYPIENLIKLPVIILAKWVFRAICSFIKVIFKKYIEPDDGFLVAFHPYWPFFFNSKVYFITPPVYPIPLSAYDRSPRVNMFVFFLTGSTVLISMPFMSYPS